MKLIKGIKNKTRGIVVYVYNFSTGQAAAGLGAGAGTVYFLGEVLKKVIGNIPAFSIAIVSGTIVGIITIYGAEKDNKKLIAEILVEIKKEKNLYQQLQINYLKTKGKHEVLDLQQITDSTHTKLFLILQNIFYKLHHHQTITEEDLQIKTLIQRVSTFSQIRGDLSTRSADPLETMSISLDLEDDQIDAEQKGDDIGFLKKILIFLRNSKAFPRAIMLSYLAMISYYLEYSMEEIAGLDRLIAWPSSVIFAIISSPIIVYATTAPSRDKLAHVRKQLTLLNEAKINLSSGLDRLEQSYVELKQIITDPQHYQTLALTLSQSKPKDINLVFLHKLFREFNVSQSAKSQPVEKKNIQQNFRTSPQKNESLTISVPATPKTPLLWGNNTINSSKDVPLDDLKKSINQPPATQSNRCIIL